MSESSLLSEAPPSPLLPPLPGGMLTPQQADAEHASNEANKRAVLDEIKKRHGAGTPAASPPDALAGGSEIPTYLQPLANKIKGGESGNRNVLYGGRPVPPGGVIPGAIGPTGQQTHSFSEYQFQPETWNKAAEAAVAQGRVLDYQNPKDRDWAFVHTARSDYKARTGRDLDADARAGRLDETALAGTWEALRPRGGGGMDPAFTAASADARRVRQGYGALAEKYNQQARDTMGQLTKYGVKLDQSMARIREATEQGFQAQQNALKSIQPMPQQPQLDAVKQFGGLATLIGIAAGMFTRHPLNASLNAAGAAMEAYNKGDYDRYRTSFDAWKVNTDMLFKIAEMNHQHVHDIIADEKLGLDERRSLLDVTLRGIGMSTLADQAKIHGDEAVLDWDAKMGQMMHQAGLAQERLQEIDKRIREQHELKIESNPMAAATEQFRKESIQKEGREPTAQEWQNFNRQMHPSKSALAEATSRFIQEGEENGTPRTSEEISKFYATTMAGAGALRNLTYGTAGVAVKSFSVSIDHLKTLEDAAMELKNGPTQKFNALKQRIAAETGSPEPTNFDAIKVIVGGEITKAIQGSAGALRDREEYRDNLNRASSPEQILGAIAAYKRLMAGQLAGTRRQFHQFLTPEEFDAYLSPEAKRQLEAAANPSSSGNAGALPATAPAGGGSGGAGSVIKYDAQGNRVQ